MDGGSLLLLTINEYLCDQHPGWEVRHSLYNDIPIVYQCHSDARIFIHTDTQELRLHRVYNRSKDSLVDCMNYTDATLLQKLSYYINKYDNNNAELQCE